MAYLLTLVEALRAISDPADLRAVACRLLGEYLRCSLVQQLDVVDDEAIVQRDDYLTTAQSLIGRHPLEVYRGETLDLMRRGETLVITDAENDQRNAASARAELARLGVGATIVVSRLVNGRLAGVFCASEPKPREWTPFDVALVEDTAAHVWSATEHARAVAALHDSEERLRLAVDAASLALWDCDLVQGTATWSDRSRWLLGLDSSEWDFEALVARVHTDDQALFRRAATEAMSPEGDGRYACQFRATGADGTVRWLADRGRVYFADGAGGRHPSRAIGVAVDITGQVQEATAREAAARHAFLLELSDELYPLSDAVEIQRAACGMLGRRLGVSRTLYFEFVDDHRAICRADYVDGVASVVGPHRLTNAPGPGFLQPELRAGRTTVVDDVATDPRLADWERRRLTNAGVGALVRVGLVKGGRWIGYLGVSSVRARTWAPWEAALVEETAERTWAALERAYAREAAVTERARRELLEREFIANAAHELRTPLTGIIGAVDALTAGAMAGDDSRGLFLGHLRRESERLARLSDSLLLLAQAESARDVRSEPVAVGTLLATAATQASPPDGVLVSIDAPDDLSVATNRGLAEVILANLVGNAAKYTERGRIELRARRVGTTTVVEVSDTGSGMTAATAERAQDRFYRGEGRSGHGFGLGLSIAKQAAEAVGATLTVHSAPGVGTRACLVFPHEDP